MLYELFLFVHGIPLIWAFDVGLVILTLIVFKNELCILLKHTLGSNFQGECLGEGRLEELCRVGCKC